MAEQKHSTLGVPKDEFLAHVRRSLGRPETSEPEVPYHRLTENLAGLDAQVMAARQRIQEESGALVERFAETAQLRSWNLFRTTSSEAAIGYIAELARTLGVTQIVRSNQPVFEELPIDPALLSQGIESITVARDEDNPRDQLRSQIIGSGIGMTGADYAVVVLPRKGLSRLVSLVPPVHVAVVRVEDVVESLDDVFLFRRLEYHQNGGDMGSYLNFISGPSRTADIEMKLVVGVHGPREVHLVLLG